MNKILLDTNVLVYAIHDYEILSIGLANQIKTVATFNAKDFDKIAEIQLHQI